MNSPTPSGSVPLPSDTWLNVGVIADEVEERMKRFAHHPPILIRDSAFGVLPGTTVDDGTAGAVFQGKVYLFRDQMATRVDVQRALFHELLHYGLRRFLTHDDYIMEMQRLALRDRYLYSEAKHWTQSEAGRRVAEQRGEPYAMARGVDEALAALAEPNAGIYLRTSLAQRVIRAVTGWAAELADRLHFPPIVSATIRGYKNEEARLFIQSVFASLERDAPATSVDWAFTADTAFKQGAGRAAAAALPIAPGLYSGQILSIADGVVVQKVGRRPEDVVRYDLSRLDQAPVVGQVCDVSFGKDGRGIVMSKSPTRER